MYTDYNENYEEELKEAESLIKNGASKLQVMRKNFQYLEQGEIYKLFRKYGRDMNEEVKF